MDIGKVFGERLLKLREERNETQDQLAKAVGITRQSLSRYETNERTPNIELIYNIAKHYNVSADYLLGLSEVQSLDNRVQAACEVTGLSNAAIAKLQYIYENADKYTTNRVECISNSSYSSLNGLFVFDVITAIEVVSKFIESKYFELLIGDTQMYAVFSKMENGNQVTVSEELANNIKNRPIVSTYNYFITPKIIAETKMNHASDCVKKIVKEISESQKEVSESGEHNPETE